MKIYLVIILCTLTTCWAQQDDSKMNNADEPCLVKTANALFDINVVTLDGKALDEAVFSKFNSLEINEVLKKLRTKVNDNFVIYNVSGQESNEYGFSTKITCKKDDSWSLSVFFYFNADNKKLRKVMHALSFAEDEGRWEKREPKIEPNGTGC